MKFVVDESVSYAVVEKLRELEYEVISVAKDYTSLKDQDVYKLAVAEKAILITRDYHFTNSIRFPPEKTNGIVYIRHGNLKSEEEARFVLEFAKKYIPEKIRGSLIILQKRGIKIRPARKSWEAEVPGLPVSCPIIPN
jgi:predicted nuclease of predicted toxin-antitoxin system